MREEILHIRWAALFLMSLAFIAVNIWKGRRLGRFGMEITGQMVLGLGCALLSAPVAFRTFSLLDNRPMSAVSMTIIVVGLGMTFLGVIRTQDT